MSDSKWRVQYSNDTGPNDEYFQEWFELIWNERTIAKFDDEANAVAVCKLLNETGFVPPA